MEFSFSYPTSHITQSYKMPTRSYRFPLKIWLFSFSILIIDFLFHVSISWQFSLYLQSFHTDFDLMLSCRRMCHYQIRDFQLCQRSVNLVSFFPNLRSIQICIDHLPQLGYASRPYYKNLSLLKLINLIDYNYVFVA